MHKEMKVTNGKIYILFDCPDEKNDKAWLIQECKKFYGEQRVVSVGIKEVLSRLSRQGRGGSLNAII